MYQLDKVYGLKGPWSVSRRGPEPRRFFGDAASLARDNINMGKTPRKVRVE